MYLQPGMGASAIPSQDGVVRLVKAEMELHHFTGSRFTKMTLASGYTCIISGMKSEGGRSAVATNPAVALRTNFRVVSVSPRFRAS